MMKSKVAVAEISTKTTISLDIKTAAAWFAALSDEEQADFLIEAAREASAWNCQGHWSEQFFLVGRHLRDCECSTEDARQLVNSLAGGLEAERMRA